MPRKNVMVSYQFFSCNNHKEYSENGVDNMDVIIYGVYLARILNEAVYGVKNYANPGECSALR